MILVGLAVALWGCSGARIIAGDQDTLSITASPFAGPDAVAERYCRGYGKRAVALGSRPLGPSTTTRLYAYNCVEPANPHG